MPAVAGVAAAVGVVTNSSTPCTDAGYRGEIIIGLRKVVGDNTNNGCQGLGGALI